MDHVADNTTPNKFNKTLRSGASENEIPRTGVEAFDKPIHGTDVYNRWVKRIEKKYGVKVKEIKSSNNFRAEIDYNTMEITINTSYFNRLDLMHENRHFMQLSRLRSSGIDITKERERHQKVLRGWFEKGAYEYELRISAALIRRGKSGFSEEYINWVKNQIRFYWHPGIQNKSQHFDDITKIWN